jgi:DNA-binding transcriptional MerR regulator
MGDVHDGFLISQVERLTGVDRRTLDFWDRSGFLSPSRQAATGKGSQRLWSFDDLVALKVAGQLRGLGVSLQALRKVAAYLKGHTPPSSFANTFLVSDGVDIYERQGDELISTLRRPGQSALAWVVDVGTLVEELEAALAA